jgi:hypothetical protein
MHDVERQLKELGERTAEEIRHGEVPGRRIVRRARLRRGVAVVGTCAVVALAAGVVVPLIDRPGRTSTNVPDLAAAVRASEHAGSARVSMELEMEFQGQAMKSTATGEVSFDDDRSYLRMEVESAYGAGDMEMIAIGNTKYQRGAGEDVWWKTEVDRPAGAAPFGSSPDQFFSQLEEVSDVTTVGEEVIDGVAVTHLRAVVDPSALPEHAADHVEIDPIEVWVDGDGLLRRLTTSNSFDGGPGGTGSMTMTITFSDYGAPVDIEAPPPEDVTEDRPSWAPPTPPADEPLDTMNLPDAWLVTGENGIDETYLIVSATQDGHFSTTCVRGLPFSARVTIRDEESGRAIHTFPRGDVPTVEPTEGCAHDVPMVDTILDDPARFTLRLRIESGWGDVPMTTARPAPPPPE